MVYFGEQMGTGVTLLTCSKGRDEGIRGVEDNKNERGLWWVEAWQGCLPTTPVFAWLFLAPAAIWLVPTNWEPWTGYVKTNFKRDHAAWKKYTALGMSVLFGIQNLRSPLRSLMDAVFPWTLFLGSIHFFEGGVGRRNPYERECKILMALIARKTWRWQRERLKGCPSPLHLCQPAVLQSWQNYHC